MQSRLQALVICAASLMPWSVQAITPARAKRVALVRKMNAELLSRAYRLRKRYPDDPLRIYGPLTLAHSLSRFESLRDSRTADDTDRAIHRILARRSPGFTPLAQLFRILRQVRTLAVDGVEPQQIVLWVDVAEKLAHQIDSRGVGKAIASDHVEALIGSLGAWPSARQAKARIQSSVLPEPADKMLEGPFTVGQMQAAVKEVWEPMGPPV